MSKLDLQKQFIAANTIPRYAKAGKVVKGASKVGELLSEAEKEIALEKAAKKAKVEKEKFPIELKRARPLTPQEITEHADRVARQQLGEHVRMSEVTGNPKDAANLAGRSARESARVQGIQYTLQPVRELRPTPTYKSKVGDVNIALPGDQTISDKRLIDVDGLPIESTQEGGSLYGEGKLHLDDPLFWASNEAVAQQFQDKVTALSQLYNTEDVMAHHLAMGQASNNYAMHFADANLRAIANTDMKPKDIKAFNEIIRAGFKDPKGKPVKLDHFVGIEYPEQAYLQMMEDPALRKWFNNRMKVPKITEKLGMPNGLDIQWAITEPELRNMEINLTGHSVGKMKPGAELTDTADHFTYESGIPGISMGKAEELAPFEVAFPDATDYVRATQRPQDFTGTIQKVFPSQVVDQQQLDQMSEYYRRLREIRGFAKGGKVGKAAKALEELQKLYDKAEAEKKAEKAVKAPTVMKRSGITELKKQIEERKGKYGGQRVEKAGDLVPNLEQQYTQSALMRAFTGEGDNAAGVMVINPKDFEKYATEIPPDYVNQKNIDELAAIARDSGFSDVPYLLLHRDEIDSIPKELQELMIAGHEGRHRTRALKELGDEATLVRMIPRASMREHLPRRSQEEYIDALNKELGLYPLVRPEANFDMESELLINRPLVKLPKIFKEGGKVDLNEEFVKENTLADGGSPYGKGSGRPAIKPMEIPSWEVLRRTGKLAGKQIKKELTEASPKQTAIDIAGGLVADTLGFPADIANYRPEPMESKATPFGIKNERKRPPAEERTPIAGSDNFRRLLQENGIISGVERPLTEGLSALVSPAALVKAPKLVKGIPKLVKELENMPAGMSVKPVGGQWDDTTRLKIEEKLGNVTQNEDVSNWLKTTGRKYIMNRMGTPEDEVRKLLDKDISHISEQKLLEMGTDISRHDKDMVRAKRKMAGFPAEGEAETAAGKRWEMMTDEFVNPNPASLYQDPRFIESNPWVAKVDPDTPIYSGERGPSYLVNETGMKDIAEALERSLKEGTLKPEQLNKVSMEDAVKLAHSYRVKDEAEVAKELPVVFDYPESGMAWHEITHEDPDVLRKILKREGESMQNCIGNYCEDVVEDGTRLFSLRDKSGKPHVNIELKPTQGVMFSQMEAELGEEASRLLEAGWTPKEIVNKYPELKKYRQYRVNQIKGKQNEAPIQDYIPFVQDFIGKQGPFTEVRDLGNAGMIDLRRVKEHGLFDEDIPAVNRELNRIFPAEMSRFGSAVLSGQHGVRIPPYTMMKEALKDMEGDYVSTDTILNYLRSQEARPVEHGYSNFWLDEDGNANFKKGGKITKSNLDEEFKINRYMR